MEGFCEFVEIVVFDVSADFCVHLVQLVEDELFEFWHFVEGEGFVRGEAVDGAENETQCVADAAVEVAGGFEHVFADFHVFGIVGSHGPEAEDVGALLFHQFERVDDVAQ